MHSKKKRKKISIGTEMRKEGRRKTSVSRVFAHAGHGLLICFFFFFFPTTTLTSSCSLFSPLFSPPPPWPPPSPVFFFVFPSSSFPVFFAFFLGVLLLLLRIRSRGEGVEILNHLGVNLVLKRVELAESQDKLILLLCPDILQSLADNEVRMGSQGSSLRSVEIPLDVVVELSLEQVVPRVARGREQTNQEISAGREVSPTLESLSQDMYD